MLNVITARTATAIKALVISQREAQDRIARCIAQLSLLLCSGSIVCITNNRLFTAWLLEFFIDHRTHLLDDRGSCAQVGGFTHNRFILEIGHPNVAILAVNPNLVGRGGENGRFAFVVLRHLHRCPIVLDQTVTFQPRCSKRIHLAHPYPEDAICTDIE